MARIYLTRKEKHFFNLRDILFSLYFLCLGLLGPQQIKAQNLHEAEELRQFLAKIIKKSAYNPDSVSEQAATAMEIRKILATHPVLILKIIEEKGAPQIFEQADIPIPQEKTREALEKMVPLLKSIYEMEPYYKDFPLVQESKEKVHQFVDGISEEKKLYVLNKIPDHYFLQLAQVTNQSIDQLSLSQTPAIQMLRNPQTGIKLDHVPKKLQEFLEIVFEKYFDRIPLQDKRNFILGLLELPIGATEVQKLGAFLQNSGPAVQKFFQLFGKNVKSPLIAEVMHELKSNIKPFEMEKVREIIERSYGKKIEELFDTFNEKPIAAASVGQVHLAKIKNSDQDVIVKIRRPGIEEKADRELALMEELAPEEGTKQIVRRIREAIMEEMDFRLEANNLRMGRVYHNRRKGITAVKEIPDLPAQKEVLIMEKAQGKSVDKFHDKRDLERKLQGLSDLLTIWLEEALFKGGNFHADLHSGNIFYSRKGTRPGHLITLIDFGSVGRLDRKEKKAIINLAMGVVFQSPQTIMDSFIEFSEMDDETKTKLMEKITAIIKRKDQGAGWKSNEILTSAIELGIDFPKNFIQFNRGKLFLDNQIYETIQELMKLNPSKEFIKQYGEGSLPDWLATKVLMKGLTPDLLKFFLKVGKAPHLIDKKTIKRILRHHLRPFIRETIKYHLNPPKACPKVQNDISSMDINRKYEGHRKQRPSKDHFQIFKMA